MNEEKIPKKRVGPSKAPRVGLTDLDTGAVITGELQVKSRPSIKYYSEDYILMFSKSFGNIAVDKSFTMETYRVLMFLLYKTEMKNWVQIQQSEIAEALGMKQPNVSKAIKKLVEKGIVETTAKMGKAKNYKISVDFGWRGTGAEYEKAKKQKVVDARRRFAENGLKG